MRSALDLRARKLEELAVIMLRPGMFGGPEAVWSLLHTLLKDLRFIDELGDSATLWRPWQPERFGPYGLPVLDMWFTSPGRRSNEAASVYAEVAHDLGYLPIDHRLDDPSWHALGLDDTDRYRTHDWTMREIREHLPDPSLIVGKSVFCFAPPDPGAQWVFFDFEGVVTTDDAPLRDIRLPTPRAIDGLVLTPTGVKCASDMVLAAVGRRETDSK